MTVTDILTDWLRTHGFDGLVDVNAECACTISNLLRCDAPCQWCKPGYIGPDPAHENDYLVYPTKQAVKDAEASIARVEAEEAEQK